MNLRIKKLLVVFIVLIVSCNNVTTNEHNKEDSFWTNWSRDWDAKWTKDSARIANQEKARLEEMFRPIQRYFIISYQTMLKTDHYPITGNAWFTSDDFPSKRQIDSIVYSGLNKKKECYQSVLVLNIYEFKNGSDFMRYTDFGRIHGDRDTKKKVICCYPCYDDGLQWGGELIRRTTPIFGIPDSNSTYIIREGDSSIKITK